MTLPHRLFHLPIRLQSSELKTLQSLTVNLVVLRIAHAAVRSVTTVVAGVAPENRYPALTVFGALPNTSWNGDSHPIRCVRTSDVCRKRDLGQEGRPLWCMISCASNPQFRRQYFVLRFTQTICTWVVRSGLYVRDA